MQLNRCRNLPIEDWVLIPDKINSVLLRLDGIFGLSIGVSPASKGTSTDLPVHKGPLLSKRDGSVNSESISLKAAEKLKGEWMFCVK